MRAVSEWVAKTDDAAIPPRVKLRIFERAKGRCHISGRLIRAGEAWDVDHIIALCKGGEHRESNLAPALVGPHRLKTAEDITEKATVYRKRSKHLGLRPSRQKIQSAGFRRAEPQRTASRPIQRKSEL
jgi:5-methylcytosine-specific restriction endonuclease McrA